MRDSNLILLRSHDFSVRWGATDAIGNLQPSVSCERERLFSDFDGGNIPSPGAFVLLWNVSETSVSGVELTEGSQPSLRITRSGTLSTS